MDPHTIRETVGVFDDPGKLNAAIAELESHAFQRHDFSVLGDAKDVARVFGAETVRPARAADDPDTPRGIFMRPEEKTIGATFIIGTTAYVTGCIAIVMAQGLPTPALLAAVTGGSMAGAAIGGAVVLLLARRMKTRLDRQIARGGLLLWVRTPDPATEQTVTNILSRNGGQRVHVHDIH